MKDDNFSDLPGWDDNLKDPDNEGEEWKPNPTRDACKEMYKQWATIMTMLNGCLRDNIPKDDEDNFMADHQSMILGDAYQVGAKIRSSEAGGIYVIRMENASIIRKNAQAVQSSMLVFMAEGIIEKEYGEIIRKEIDVFKEIFRKWVRTFEKDEFTDEWGLFV